MTIEELKEKLGKLQLGDEAKTETELLCEPYEPGETVEQKDLKLIAEIIKMDEELDEEEMAFLEKLEDGLGNFADEVDKAGESALDELEKLVEEKGT
jgi:DNA repair exonuclease SbcCD ATPase subunit